MLQQSLLRNFLAALLLMGCASAQLSAQTAQKPLQSVYSRKVSVTVQNNDQTVLPDGRVVYIRTEQMPEYAGNMQEFLIANIRYPEEARKGNIEGKSVVRFIVSSDGKVSDVEIARSSGNAQLDEESLRVIRLMQDWKPGMKDGYPVSVYFYLPVSYKLD